MPRAFRSDLARLRSPSVVLRSIHAYIDQTNTELKPFVWTKSADDILASVKRFCRQTSNSDH